MPRAPAPSIAPMKYVVLVPDGCADEPLEELGGRTPLEAAHMPNVAALAARAQVGRAAVIPAGMAAGSDVGNLAILGYDPAEYHTGRAPIEAAAMGIELADDEVAYRCNLVTIDHAGTMVDYAAGHITSEQSHPIIAAVDAALGDGRDGIRFFPGVEYRHICVMPSAYADADCVPPHDLTGKASVLPTGAAAAKLIALMDASKPVVGEAAARVGSMASQVWLWGQGARPRLPAFVDCHGIHGRLTSAVDLVRGLGALSGIEVVDVPGATAGFDNDYVAQRDAALASLADRDFFLLHVEATDEAGHQGRIDEKVASLERWDAQIVGPLVDALSTREAFRILMLPDHATRARCARTRPTRSRTSCSTPRSTRREGGTRSGSSRTCRRFLPTS